MNVSLASQASLLMLLQMTNDFKELSAKLLTGPPMTLKVGESSCRWVSADGRKETWVIHYGLLMCQEFRSLNYLKW